MDHKFIDGAIRDNKFLCMIPEQARKEINKFCSTCATLKQKDDFFKGIEEKYSVELKKYAQLTAKK